MGREARRRTFGRFDEERMVAEHLAACDSLVFACDQSSDGCCYARESCAAVRKAGSA
jgi:hypothetical protein